MTNQLTLEYRVYIDVISDYMRVDVLAQVY